jgi:hypothetical protein
VIACGLEEGAGCLSPNFGPPNLTVSTKPGILMSAGRGKVPSQFK